MEVRLRKWQAGTGLIILNQTIRNRILQFEMINERISKIRIPGKFNNITILSVYAPTNDKDEAIQDEFYDNLIEPSN
jgi:hypothetical protein